MSDKNIYDDEKITVNARIDGDAVTVNKITQAKFIFTLIKGSAKEVLAPQMGTASGFPRTATCEFTPPKVDKTLDYYDVTYQVEVTPPGKPAVTLNGKDTIRVWPKTVKVRFTSDDVDDIKGVKFVVSSTGKVSRTEKKTATDAGEWEGTLPQAAWTLDVDPPWKKTDVTATGREREYKVTKKPFRAVFLSPDPDDKTKPIRQLINLAATTPWKKAEPSGHTLEFKVASDKDEAKAGDLVYIECQFGHESKRTTSKPVLLATGLDGAVTKSNSDKTCKGKIKLGADKTATFKVELGQAGGDTCTVKVGSTDACGDATLQFVNWRRVYYQLMAPDFMALEERDEAGAKVKDFPAGAIAKLKSLGDSIFTEFVFHKSHTFALAAAPAGTALPRGFIGRATGPANVYILSDHTFKNYPKAFSTGADSKSPREVRIKLCDANLFADAEPQQDVFTVVKTKQADLPTDAADGALWMPKCSLDGTDTITEIKWKATLDPNAHKHKPTFTLAAPVLTAGSKKADSRSIKIKELTQNKEVTVVFAKSGMLSDVSTDLSTSEKGKIDPFLNSLFNGPTLRRNGNKLQFQIEAETGNARRDLRKTNVESTLTARFNALAPEIPFHPALDDNGVARTGNLPLTAVNMGRSTQTLIAVDLPDTAATDPGKWVGDPTTAGKSEIRVSCKFKPHREGLGLAGRGAQKGEILVVFDKDHLEAMIEIVIHEVGHQMNMTVFSGAADSHAPGFTVSKHVDEDEANAAYKNNGDKGHVYRDHGHSGSHCAFGLSDANKLLAAYDDASANAKCIMFGSNDLANANRRSFCVQCQDYIKARDVSTIEL